MMKRFTYSFLFFISCSVSTAQINFNVVKADVKCNHASYGNVEVVVSSTNPPYTYLWNTGETTSFLNDVDDGTYSVTITDGSLNDTSVSVVVNLIVCQMAPEIILTPNSDGINDTWFILNSQYFPNAKFMVYNRLGQKVFDYKGVYTPWDGKDLLGITLPDASYYYIIYHDNADEGTIIKGCISIIK